MSLSVKNMLGGSGGGASPFAWGKYEHTEETPIIHLNQVAVEDYSYYIDMSSSEVDVSTLTKADIVGLMTTRVASGSVNTYWTFGETNVVRTINGSSSTSTYSYTVSNGRITISLGGTGGNTIGTWSDISLPTIINNTFLEYVTDKNPLKYPNGEVHTDGFFYRYAFEGLYVWGKSIPTKIVDDAQAKLANMPVGAYENSAVSYNGKIHVFGNQSSGYMNIVQIYDDGANKWSYSADMPYNYLEGFAVVYHDKVHILGGYTSQKYHYSWDGTTWTNEGELPYQFFRGTACVYNDKIHILGGYITSNTNNGSKYHYSWDGETWTEESTLPYFMRHGACTVYNDKIHLIGGHNCVNYHYSWDGTTWTNEGDMPYGTRMAQAHTYRECIYVFSGYYDTSNKLYKYDGNSWEAISLTLDGTFIDSPSVIHSDNLYILGSNGSTYRGQFYKVLGYKIENVPFDTVISDDENAYPNGGEYDGYYYQKSGGINPEMLGYTKMATDTFMFSANATISNKIIQHSLGEIPKLILIIASKFETSNQNYLNAMLIINDSQNSNALNAVPLTRSGTDLTTHGNASYMLKTWRYEDRITLNNSSTSYPTLFIGNVEYTMFTMA